MFFLVRNCSTTNNVWLSALSWCRNHTVPATCCAASCEFHHATSAILAHRSDE
jgi:hypothetical protein